MARTDISFICCLGKGSLLAANIVVGLGLVVFAPAAVKGQAVSETVLHNFCPAVTDGASVYSGLVLARNGRLYGTTWGGGSLAGGTVFGVNTDGTGYAILHHFANAPDGGAPYDGLIQGMDGALYGTTYSGGTADAGTVFKIRTDGSGYQVLRSFGGAPDAAYPWAGLVQGRDGLLYGTTLSGGESNLGTVFKVNTNGSGYQVLHSFISNFQDGFTPYASLIQGLDGGLYGTTYQGGRNLGGTVFRITTDGSLCEILHHFQSGTGYWPRAAVIQGNDGMLYGTAFSGGPTNGGGVVFRLGTNGLDYTVLHGFPAGADLSGNVIQASDGALYGTTQWKGSSEGGTVYRLRPDGTEYSIVHEFPWSSVLDGAHPVSGLVAGGGALYGTTLSGGTCGFGTVYRLTFPPLLSISASPQGPRLTITGLSGQPCRLDSTTNQADWTPRAILVLTNGVAAFVETNASTAPTRFYRAVVQ